MLSPDIRQGRRHRILAPTMIVALSGRHRNRILAPTLIVASSGVVGDEPAGLGLGFNLGERSRPRPRDRYR